MTLKAPEAIASVIAGLTGKGVELSVDKGEIVVRGRVDKADLDVLRRCKAEIVQHLTLETGRHIAASTPRLIVESERPSFASIGALGFPAMLHVDRLVDRTPDFDRMILSADDHAWSPLDRRYLDFETPFDTKVSPIIDQSAFACLKAPIVARRLADAADRTRFINKIAWIRFSNLLHGEQGALNLSASLCGVLRDQGAQEFAANQTREEARHVTAFARYIKVRWGRPAPVLLALAGFLKEIVEAPDVAKKIIGMQVMVEGLAMGSLGSLHKVLLDPVGKRLVQLVMTDEAFHHKFGKLWVDETMPGISRAERERLETWTSHCLTNFIVRMNPPIELRVLFRDFGLDPKLVGQEIQDVSALRVADTALGAKETFRVLTRTLLSANLLSKDSEAAYRAYLDADAGSDAEPDYEDIVRDGLEFLRDVNHAEPLETAHYQ